MRGTPDPKRGRRAVLTGVLGCSLGSHPFPLPVNDQHLYQEGAGRCILQAGVCVCVLWTQSYPSDTFILSKEGK